MFSVLLSLYHKEKPEYLEKCFESIWDNQSLKPSEIVLVLDVLLVSNSQLLYRSGKLKSLKN